MKLSIAAKFNLNKSTFDADSIFALSERPNVGIDLPEFGLIR